MTHEGELARSSASGDPSQTALGLVEAELADVRGSRRRLIEAAMADRRQLERALHDGLQQELSAVAIELSRLGGLMNGQREAAKALLEEIVTGLRDAMAEADRLARMIYPPLLDGRGFATCLRSAAADVGLIVAVDAPSASGYPAEFSATMYLLCVEAIASATPGSEATVRITDEGGRVAFDVSIVGSQPPSRLQRLEDLAEGLGGRLDVEHGTWGSRVHGWLPSSS